MNKNIQTEFTQLAGMRASRDVRTKMNAAVKNGFTAAG